jgi:hypothetical protein
MISSPPINRFVHIISHPNNDERMIDGANTLIPVESPRDKRNNNDVRVLVLLSNLDSRYS